MRVLSGFAFSICPHYFCCSITLPIGLASRFRMKQVNVVGTSPFSPSSRVIQTLQAPPDVAPTSITVRTASETSLRLRWVVSVGVGARGGGRGGSLESPRCTCEPGAESCLSNGLFSSRLISSLTQKRLHFTIGVRSLSSPGYLVT